MSINMPYMFYIVLCSFNRWFYLSLSLSIREWCQTYPIIWPSNGRKRHLRRALCEVYLDAWQPGPKQQANQRAQWSLSKHAKTSTRCNKEPLFSFLKVQTKGQTVDYLSLGFTRHAFFSQCTTLNHWRPSQILHWYRFLPSSSKRSLTRTSCRKVSALWWKKSCTIRDWGVSVLPIAALETPIWNALHLASFGNTSSEQKEKHIQDHTSRWAGK